MASYYQHVLHFSKPIYTLHVRHHGMSAHIWNCIYWCLIIVGWAWVSAGHTAGLIFCHSMHLAIANKVCQPGQLHRHGLTFTLKSWAGSLLWRRSYMTLYLKFLLSTTVHSSISVLSMTEQPAFIQECRKEFWRGPAVIGTREARTQFLLNRRKSGPAKTGPAGPAPMPMS